MTIKLLRAKEDLHFKGDVSDIFCTGGKWYDVVDENGHGLVLVNDLGDEHPFSYQYVNDHFHTIDFDKGFDFTLRSDGEKFTVKSSLWYSHQTGDTGLLDTIKERLEWIKSEEWQITRYSNQEDESSLAKFNVPEDKPERPLENWIKTITSYKLDRVKKMFPEVKKNIWWDEDESMLYLYYVGQRGIFYSDKNEGVPTRISLKGKEGLIEKLQDEISWYKLAHETEVLEEKAPVVTVEYDWDKVMGHLKERTQKITESMGCSFLKEQTEEDLLMEGFSVVDSGEGVIDESTLKEGTFTVEDSSQWTDKHYNFEYTLTEKDIEKGNIKLDPYFIAKEWKIGSKDDSGALWHCFKTIARFGEKNGVEREIKALNAQIKRLAEINSVDLSD